MTSETLIGIVGEVLSPQLRGRGLQGGVSFNYCVFVIPWQQLRFDRGGRKNCGFSRICACVKRQRGRRVCGTNLNL